MQVRPATVNGLAGFVLREEDGAIDTLAFELDRDKYADGKADFALVKHSDIARYDARALEAVESRIDGALGEGQPAPAA